MNTTHTIRRLVKEASSCDLVEIRLAATQRSCSQCNNRCRYYHTAWVAATNEQLAEIRRVIRGPSRYSGWCLLPRPPEEIRDIARLQDSSTSDGKLLYPALFIVVSERILKGGQAFGVRGIYLPPGLLTGRLIRDELKPIMPLL